MAREVLLAVFAEYGDFHFAVFIVVSLFPLSAVELRSSLCCLV